MSNTASSRSKVSSIQIISNTGTLVVSVLHFFCGFLAARCAPATSKFITMTIRIYFPKYYTIALFILVESGLEHARQCTSIGSA